MKNRDLFELETALAGGCRSKHWALMKPVNKMLAIVRTETEPHRAALAPTEAMKKYQGALRHLRAENAGEKPEVLNEKMQNLIAEHKQAIIDGLELQQADAEMAEDDVPAELVEKLEPLPEALLHDGGMLRIEPEAYLTLSRLGLVKE